MTCGSSASSPISSHVGVSSSTLTRSVSKVRQVTTKATLLSQGPMPTRWRASGAPRLSTPPGSTTAPSDSPAVIAFRNDCGSWLPSSSSPASSGCPPESAAMSFRRIGSTWKGVWPMSP
jgi:hypothetical protein